MEQGKDSGGIGAVGATVLSALLSVAFFVVLTPIGLLMRAFGKDLLKLRRDPGAASYWVARRPPGHDPKSMVRQF